jgi:hypothetical protein
VDESSHGERRHHRHQPPILTARLSASLAENRPDLVRGRLGLEPHPLDAVDGAGDQRVLAFPAPAPAIWHRRLAPLLQGMDALDESEDELDQ